MSCSCGYVQRFLLPCRHICAVLDYIEYYEPSLFHIRWHKDFNYHHGNSLSRNIARNTDTVLRELLVYTRANHYTQSGKYKGIPMMDSEFMKNLPPFSMSDLHQLMLRLMQSKILCQILLMQQKEMGMC